MPQRGGEAAPLVERHDLGEALELQARVAEVGLVGVGEVREDALHVDVLARERGFQQCAGAVPVHADPLHARVDLEVYLGAGPERGGVLLDGAELVHRRGGEHEVVLEEAGDLLADDASEHEDRRAHALLAQPHALFEVRHAEHRRPEPVEQSPHRHEAVAVGVGLENGHEPHAGAHVGLDRVVVAGELREVDLDAGGPELVAGDGGLVQGRRGR